MEQTSLINLMEMLVDVYQCAYTCHYLLHVQLIVEFTLLGCLHNLGGLQTCLQPTVHLRSET